ncbi:hypothetical protein D4R42_05090, partial [bacterium]
GDAAIRATVRAVDAGALNTRLVSELGIATALETVAASAVAASVSAAGPDFACRSEDLVGATSAAFDGSYVGTGINVNGANYADSAFTFTFEALIGYRLSNRVLDTYFASLRGVLKKTAGSSIVTCEMQNSLGGDIGGIRPAQASWAYSTLDASGDTISLAVSSLGVSFTKVGIERTHDATGELKFRLYAITSAPLTWGATFRISGPRVLTDAPLTPSGTVF